MTAEIIEVTHGENLYCTQTYFYTEDFIKIHLTSLNTLDGNY